MPTLTILLGLILAQSTFAQSVTKIESFTPTGIIPAAEQVHVKFSDFMFELGKQNVPAPFRSTCDTYGKGRWLNPTEWVFEFSKALPALMSCEFKLVDGLKSQKGIPLIAGQSFTFQVTPAQIASTVPYGVTELQNVDRKSGSIDPDQAFVIHFDKKISNAEIQSRLFFTVEGRREPIGIKILDSKYLKMIATEGREWIRPDPNETWVVIQPVLDFPNQERLLVTLNDKNFSQKYYYQTRLFFSAEFTCSRDNANAPCSPVQQVELAFNSPVAVDDIKKMKIVGSAKDSAVILAKPSDSDSTVVSHEDRAIFKGPFKAGATYRLELPKKLTDIRGRTLKNAASFPLTFKTDGLPAVAKFPGNFGVIEAENPVLPLSVRNIEKNLTVQSSSVVRYSTPQTAVAILNWLERVKSQEARFYGDTTAEDFKHRPNYKAANYESVFKGYAKEISGKTDKTSLPTLHEAQQAEVIGIPLTENKQAQKGLQIVELESKILGSRILDRDTALYTSTAVLVTNLGVHFKWGQGGPSLVWVTELSTGKPVADAEIKIEACDGKSIASGKTGADGTLTLEKLPTSNQVQIQNHCTYETYDYAKLVVMAKKGDDFSFTLDSWKQGLESWRFNISGGHYYGGDEESNDVVAHTILARDYLKPGQKVNMKHYVREFHWQGFTVPKKLPKFVVIQHLGSEEKWNIPVKFNAQGIATTDWTLSENANLGDYSISLAYDLPKKGSAFKSRSIRTGQFEVQEFRLPTLNVAMKIPDPITAATEKPRISLQGTYLSGGPATQLPVELRFQRKVVQKHSRVIGDLLYAQDEEVKTGIVEKKDYNEEAFDEPTEGAPEKKKEDSILTSKLLTKLNLDAAGSAYVDFPKEVLDTDQDADVYVALNYTDPNGEIQSSVRSTSVYSRDRYLAIDKEFKSYYDSPKDLMFNFGLGTIQGAGVPNEKIEVTLYQQIDYVHRSRLVGGFYGYQTTTETKKVGELCSGKTSESGRFKCLAKVPGPGRYLLQANAKDSKGKALTLVQELYIWGSDNSYGDYSESDRLTLIPNHDEYEAGDNAEITIQSPFKQFTALVTLEREGVMDHKIVELSGAKPVVTIPVLAPYSPNVVVSIFAVRGRVGEPSPTGLLDLAKPAFKMGMVALKVGKKGHELPITVKTDKLVYQVRETAKVSIETKPGAEMALAVVDKALLKLKPNTTWDLLNSMITQRSHQVETSTLQMNIIGKRHFGKKATPFGGGGGNGMTRELLDSLIAWVPNLKADANGKIQTQFKLNDSISGFIVVAIGTEGLNLFGTAKTEIAATQDLQIISSIPPTLRERDQLPLQFILRNTTLNPLHVTATLKMDAITAAPQEIEIPSQGAKEVKWTDTIPMGITSRTFTLNAIAKEGPKDALKVTSKVVEVLPAHVVEGYLQQLGADSVATPITFPKEAALDKGGFRVQVQARLSEAPDSLLTYLRKYPFSCFEQQTSKAIGLEDVAAWKKLIKGAKSYLDSNSLLKFFPEMRYGSVDLTAYVLKVAAEAGQNNPAFSLPQKGAEAAMTQRLVESTRKAMRGEILISQTWWPAYVTANQRIAAGEALSYYEPISPADYEALKSIRDSKSLDHSLSLMNVLLQSKKLTKNPLVNSMGDLATYASEISTHYQFENTHLRLKDKDFWFFGPLGASPDGLKARTLIAFVNQDQKDNATKLLRAMIEEMKRGYMDTTPGNAWSVVALKRFKQKYENDPVAGSVLVKLASVSNKVAISEKKPKAETFVSITNDGVKKALASGSVSLNQSYTGSGKPWSFTLVEAAIPIKASVDHGYAITKSIEMVQNAKKGTTSRGDLYQVKISIEARSPQTWLVLMDPIPTGASILSTETNGGWIAFEERRMDRMQVFFEYLPQGKTEFTYTVRLNQVGSFEFPSTRLEAMYDPTQYGETPNAKMTVQE
jgi:uncharacterized protein YfaS (alpha-2-macroglobulin family)